MSCWTLVELDLTYDDAGVGKQLKDLALPPDCVIVSIQRGGQVVVPRGSTRLLAGDRVIALAHPSSEAGLRRVLHQGGAASADSD